MKTKRMLCVLAAMSLLSALTACGSSSSEPEPAPAPAAESSAAPEESQESSAEGGSDFSVTFSPLTDNVYDVANCDPFTFQAGDSVIGEIKFSLGPVATFSEGSYVMYNRMQFYAVMINDVYVLMGAPNSAGSSGSLSLLSSQSETFLNSYREDMTEEELAQIRPWTSAQIDTRVEPLPDELKDIFANFYGEGFEQGCVTNVYLVDNAYRE